MSELMKALLASTTIGAVISSLAMLLSVYWQRVAEDRRQRELRRSEQRQLAVQLAAELSKRAFQKAMIQRQQGNAVEARDEVFVLQVYVEAVLDLLDGKTLEAEVLAKRLDDVGPWVFPPKVSVTSPENLRKGGL